MMTGLRGLVLLLAATAVCGRYHQRLHNRHHQRGGFRYHVATSASSQGVVAAASSSSSSNVVPGATSDAKAVVYISKLKPGRHVCSQHKEVSQTVSKREPYSKRTYKTYTQPCENNQVCQGVRAVYHTAYRTVYDTQPTRQTSYYCCPGWSQIKFSMGCTIAICAVTCSNGGSCIKPDTCSCPPGFTGPFCETDIDECQEKLCDQLCINSPGSFQCQCREGFTLLEDGRSCRSEGKIATEAKDLNEVEILAKRVQKLEQETILETSSETVTELSKKIETIIDRVQFLKNQLNNIVREQEEQRRLLEQLRHSEPVIQRIAPLCKQVSVIQQKLDECHCRSSYWHTIIS